MNEAEALTQEKSELLVRAEKLAAALVEAWASAPPAIEEGGWGVGE